MYFKTLLCALIYLVSFHVFSSQTPYISVLGVAQDAGYPQAGCYQPHCMDGWLGNRPRVTATSLGLIDPINRKKYLFEATPHLSSQLFRLEQLAPSSEYELAGVFLTHAHIGHYAGLMYFGHEVMGAKNVPVYAMPKMRQFLENNGPWSQLIEYKNIQLIKLQNQMKTMLAGNRSTLSVEPLIVPHRDEFSETVGYKIYSKKKTALFIPDIDKWQKWDKDIVAQIRLVDYALVDATFFAQGELPGRDMSKVPHPLVTESMALFEHLSKEEKNKVWFIHFNHTNPLLDRQSEESRLVKSKGFNIAYEGLKLEM